jgi:DNA-binding Xre family transcriptional regulator
MTMAGVLKHHDDAILYADFKRNVYVALAERNWTQRELARRADTTESNISLILSHKLTGTTLHIAYRIANALELTLNDLVSRPEGTLL